MALTINDVRNLGDPQRSYKWEVIMPTIGLITLVNNNSRKNSYKLTGKSTINGTLDVDQPRTASIFVEEVEGLPFSKIDSEAFYEGGSNTYFPGIKDIDRVTLFFYQNESSYIPAYLESWKSLVVQPNGLRNFPSEYKHDIVVRLLDGRNNVTVAFRLRGTFPTVTTPLDLNYETGRVRFAQEFSIDSSELLSANTVGTTAFSLDSTTA
jgi:hypothetical protein